MRKSLCAIASLRLCEAFLQSPPISFSHYDHDRKERFGQYGTKPLFFSMTSSSSPVNGETFNIEGTVSDDGLVSSAPISYDKYVLMQVMCCTANALLSYANCCGYTVCRPSGIYMCTKREQSPLTHPSKCPPFFLQFLVYG